MTARALWIWTVMELLLLLPALWLAFVVLVVLGFGAYRPAATAAIAVTVILTPVSCLAAPLLAWRASRRGRPKLTWAMLALPAASFVLFVVTSRLLSA